jgi:DNA-directed RNA polymerase specialized sigma24 family protein
MYAGRKVNGTGLGPTDRRQPLGRSDTLGRVFDKDAPSSQQVFAELAKGHVRTQLHRYATWRTRDEDKAKDLVADALLLVCDPEKGKTWDPAKRSFFGHMRRVLDDLAIQRKRVGPGRFEINETDLVRRTRNPDAFPDPADEHALADEALAAHFELAWLRSLGRALLERLAGKDQRAVEVYRAACIHEEPAEQCRHLGIPVEEVYEAHRRLRYHGAIVKTEWERAEAARMSEIQRGNHEKEGPS